MKNIVLQLLELLTDKKHFVTSIQEKYTLLRFRKSYISTKSKNNTTLLVNFFLVSVIRDEKLVISHECVINSYLSCYFSFPFFMLRFHCESYFDNLRYLRNY